ncbi:hypothetical protein Smp_047020 [Schistosoma mansoni]|nr:hypothetical protein Smp_047020 [Schistosoma mansoni]|eukprot:XP_018654726.1 hypothetical protein Smp_047020 [Schistosoma mansoni]
MKNHSNVNIHTKLNTEGYPKAITATTTTTTITTPRKHINRLSKDTHHKVTIIPVVDNHSNYNEHENYHTISPNNTEIQYVILPRLDSSPNRRRRFIKSESINPYHNISKCQTNVYFNTVDNETTFNKTRSVLRVINPNDKLSDSAENNSDNYFNDNLIANTSHLEQYSSLTNILSKVGKNLISMNLDQQEQEQRSINCLVEKESVL